MPTISRCRARASAGVGPRVAPLALALLLLTSCVTGPQWSTYPGTLDQVSGDQWAADLEHLDTELRARHPDPFHNRREGEYIAILSQLAADARAAGPSVGRPLADDMVTGMARLLATVGEGHTSLNASPDAWFPLVTRWFGPEGSRELRVVQARVADAAALGDEVIAIGELPLSTALSLLDECLSVDHPNGFAPQEPAALINSRIARGLGLADDTGLTVTLRRPDASTYELTVPEVAAADLVLVDVWTGSPVDRDLPYHHQGEPRWYEVIGSTMYVQYNSCDLDAYGFFQGIVDELGGGRIDRLVVDLRKNGGGDSRPGTWFAKAVRGIGTVNRPGGVYVLVGPRTFSSALMMAVDFMHNTEALFAGEPLAERVDLWGEVKRFALPSSGLVIGHSTRFFTYSRGKDLRLVDGVIVPDAGLERVATYAEWAAGEDPAFDLVTSDAP